MFSFVFLLLSSMVLRVLRFSESFLSNKPFRYFFFPGLLKQLLGIGAAMSSGSLGKERLKYLGVVVDVVWDVVRICFGDVRESR